MIYLTGHGALAAELKNTNIKIKSLRNFGSKAYADADCIIHNAANLNPKSHEETYQDNVVPLSNLINSIDPNKRFIMISSMSVLQNKNMPKLIYKMNHYTRSKYICETLVKDTLKNYMIIRFSSLFYADPLRDGLSKMIYDAKTKKQITLINNGEAKRDWLPLRIAAKKILTLNTKGFKGTVNLASGNPWSFGAVAGFLKFLDDDIEIINEDAKHIEVLSDFDWNCNINLAEEIRTYYERII